ncbi:MAG: toll/interleukin-1 receptor domain-containing protein [Vicinamibacteria bacterium]
MKKDFFVSYTSVDKTWAEWIAWQLEAAGYSVVIQAWDFRPGENFVVEMQTAAAEAERTLLVLSGDYLKSAFGRSEWTAAFAQDPTGTARRVLPVRVKPCEPDGLLRAIIFVDLVGLADADARTRLLEGVVDDRAKPEVAPVFPGGTGAPVFPGPAEEPAGGPAFLAVLPDAPVEPVTAAWSLLRQIGAGAAGLAVLALGAGALAEASYARLSGLDFEPAVSTFALSGVQFFISLAIVLLALSAAAALLVLLAGLVHQVAKRAVAGWDPFGLGRRLLAQPMLLLGLQGLAIVLLLGWSLGSFADLMPFSSVVSGGGVGAAAPDLLARGTRLYRTAAVCAAIVCLTLAGLERWRRLLHRGPWRGRPRASVVSLLLSIPLYLTTLVELLLLPAGYGLLELPNSRQYDTTIVSFSPTTQREDLRGGRFQLIALGERRGRRTFFCPEPPTVIRDVEKSEIASTRAGTRGTLLQLVPKQPGCVSPAGP